MKELSGCTLEDDGEDLSRSKRMERGNILGGVNIKIDLITSLFGVKEGRFLGYMVTREGVRADPEKVQTIILSPT
ncbi:hypothetical protein Tco_0899376 [Tanacetum coccineum]